MRKFLGILCLTALTGCTTLRGDPVDLHIIARPEPDPPAPAPAPKVSSPQPPGNEWRIWVPRNAGQDGATNEGHWVELSKDGPSLQVTEPQLTIPRPPKVSFQKKKAPPAPTPVSAPHLSQYEGTPAWLAPVLPLGPNEQDGAPRQPLPGGVR